MVETRVPTTDLDPYAPVFYDDPYPLYRELRNLGPVVRLDALGVWACTGYEEARNVLGNPDIFRSGAGVGVANLSREQHWRKPSILLENDPPQHTRVRAALMGVLTPKNIRRLRTDLEPQATQIVSRAIEMRSLDAVAEIATPFPLRSFPNAVGLREEGRETLIDYGHMVFDGMGPKNEIYENVMSHSDETVRWVDRQCQRDSLAPGKFGDQVYAAADAGSITPEEAALVVRSFLSAGIDTTIHGLGSFLLCMAQRPDAWKRVHDEPSLVPPAFEETLRYESPFQKFFRTTTQSTQLAGIDLDADEKVMVLIGSANRDPSKWESPDSFIVDRRPLGHLGFGTGIHACVGQMIARLEADVLLGELARRVKSITLTAPPIWQPSNSLRGLQSLQIEIQAA